jgi:hypothetical protein
MANPVFTTRDRRLIRVSKGQDSTALSGAPLETIRFSIKANGKEITTDLTPREVHILAEVLLQYYRQTLPKERPTARDES